jgi:tetratricopeptide (TPR) repeat protein
MLASLAQAALLASALLAVQGAPSPAHANDDDPPGGEAYRAIVRSTMNTRSPGDTLGNGLYASARAAFYAGEFDSAMARAQRFTQSYMRNLRMNEALQMILLWRGYRDFEDQPLRAYAHVLSLREAGNPDSAAVVAQTALTRWPGARVRDHLHYELAELAKNRGDHALAVTHAMAVADSALHSRLAPAALELAGDETLASGQGSEKALHIYQDLLERFPDSPLATPVRVKVLELRKKLQL